ncbi:hypothetical protein [Sediminicola arcticus]|jgi:hypothetical protein|uniref:DUF4168 domain-containing protein n=1 Tax=Sediminicola arcticus TaxID=1574308 RepID=A0ABV2STH5_9FLAO|tara:strand:+ start:257 stop:712 length:456 start_codon:yes stop_codon:yes gene_type:complete
METKKNYIFTVLILLFSTSIIQAQYGNGYGNNGFGRRQSNIPQAQQTPEKAEPLTAEEIVESQMPAISEALKLNEFEKAVVSTTLVKYMKQRIEIQILQLEANKMKEAYEKINLNQDAELKAGLPEEKFEAFLSLKEDGIKKTKRKKKKKN